ncbi:MAG: hypothetical protein DRO13_02820 [Thermoprotei archaeon]|nr:MAG: hypothetical protein DRO13_02820 [Thermoprotei archaeon]
MVLSNLVQYKVRKVRGNYYLYKEWYDSEAKKRSIYIWPCERIEKLFLLLGDLDDEDIQKIIEGFEPGISGLENQHNIKENISVDVKELQL